MDEADNSFVHLNASYGGEAGGKQGIQNNNLIKTIYTLL